MYRFLFLKYIFIKQLFLSEGGLKSMHELKLFKLTSNLFQKYEKRSLVAHLDAAYHFTEDFLDCPKNWSYVEKSSVFYISVSTSLSAVDIIVFT